MFSGCINKPNYFPSLEIVKTPSCLADSNKTTIPYMFANNQETFIAELFAGPLGMMVSGVKQIWNTTAFTLGIVAFEINDHWKNNCSTKLASLLPKNGDKEIFVLNIKGNAMIENYIEDGDLVIVERRQEAKNGEMILALLDNKNATLKRFFLEEDRIRLQPVNSEYEPTFVKKGGLKIDGVVIGVMRKFD